MSNGNYKEKAGGLRKLIGFGVLLLLDLLAFVNGSIVVFLSLFAYTLLYVYLATWGSDSRIAQWIARRKVFGFIFLMPTIACALYSAGYFAMLQPGEPRYLAAFAVFLTVLSIPFLFILARSQGGIRRLNGLIAYLVFPVVLYVICLIFAENSVLVAGIASVVAAVAVFIAAVIQHGKDHKADYASEDSESEHGKYVAKWDGRPDSSVSDNVIHIRGTIIVDYTGDFYQSDADSAVEGLIQSYVWTVQSDMDGYRVDGASVNVKYRKVG